MLPVERAALVHDVPALLLIVRVQSIFLFEAVAAAPFHRRLRLPRRFQAAFACQVVHVAAVMLEYVSTFHLPVAAVGFGNLAEEDSIVRQITMHF